MPPGGLRPKALALAAAVLLPAGAGASPFYKSHNPNHDAYYNFPPPAAAQSASMANSARGGLPQSALDAGESSAAQGQAARKYGLQVPEVGAGRAADKDMVAPINARKPGEPAGGALAGSAGAAAGGAAAGGLEPARIQSGQLAPPEDPAAASWEAARRQFVESMRAGDRKLEMGDLQGALTSAESAIRAAPAAPGGYLVKATALELMSRHDESERAALMSVERGADAEAWEQLAWAQLHQGKARDAARNAGKAAQMDPRSATAFAIRAFAEESLGARADMVADLERAAALDPARYAERLELAKANVRLFDSESVDSWALLEAVRDAPAPMQQQKAPSFPWPGVLVAAAGSLGLGWFLLSRRSAARPAPAGAAAAFQGLSPEPGARPAASGPEGALGGKYIVRSPVGGSPAQAWVADDPTLSRPVFIKRVAAAGRPGAGAYREFLRRARRLGELNHPNIVDVYEILDLPSGLHLVFEHLEGKTARQLLDERRRLPVAQAVQLLRPACAALEFAHARDIRHGDLKPSNLMLIVSGYVKLLDFSLEESSAADDIRGLGSCLYALATGEAPLDAARTYVPAASRVEGLSPRFDETVRKALDPDPSRGFKSVQWFAEAIELLA